MTEQKPRGGNLLIAYMPAILVLAVLVVISISIGFRTQQLHSHIGMLGEQIKELRTISVATTTVRMKLTRRDIIEEQLARYGIDLHTMDTQPIILEGDLDGILQQSVE